MKKSYLFWFIITIVTFTFSSEAQTNSVLATANGQSYTVQDLDPATREAFEGLDQAVSLERTEALGEQISQMLFLQEATGRKITVEKLLEVEIPKRLTPPTNAEIKAVYDANRDQIGNRTVEEMRPQIVNFLQRESYSKAFLKYVSELKLKHKVMFGLDVNAPQLKPTDVLATVNLNPLTVKEFEERAGQKIYEIRAGVFEKTYEYLDLIIINELTRFEAQKLELTPEALIAREISDKMLEFSDEEREKLTSQFVDKLKKKYQFKILLNEPIPFVQKISVDDDPAQGIATAPVTVVMFSDFQCPACASTHPVLKKVMAEYGDKIRFVVRDFPLTQIHNNAFKAAEAANAAHSQGKFFEYIELLYNNQDSLDSASLRKYAAQLGLNLQKFDSELSSGKFAAEVKKDITDGDFYGISSTPTIFVNGIKVRSLSAKAIKKVIEQSLR